MSHEELRRVIETLVLPRGFEIDLDEGWRKLISRQFGGSPGRGFAELVQNFLDSYPPETPWEDRLAKIETTPASISITDYGEGMDRRRLELLVTLGGTDKKGDPSKIGRFGIGFFSVFNPSLGTRKVTVTTRCEGHTVHLVFTVNRQDERPLMTATVTPGIPGFSTRVDLEFANPDSAARCLEHAERCLNYYPCRALVNGKPFRSAWERARESGAHFFQGAACRGFVEPAPAGYRAVLLCKYEFVNRCSASHLSTGGHDAHGDLRDFRRRGLPYVPDTAVTVNCDDLSLTISRDTYHLDAAYDRMVATAVRELRRLLPRVLRDPSLDRERLRQIVLANQYLLSEDLKRRLEGKADENDEAIDLLARARVYPVNGRQGEVSLLELRRELTPRLPLFFSPDKKNLRWLGGAFKHDLIVLPSACTLEGGAPDFYDTLLGGIFGSVVNLDTIPNDPSRISALVRRGIVDRSALAPHPSIIDLQKASEEERRLISEFDDLLSFGPIRDAVARDLWLPSAPIHAVLFEVHAEGITLATGLFDAEGKAIEAASDRQMENGMLLGLRRDHPFIERLVQSGDPRRAYYGLTYLAHQLALSQRLLAPGSPFFHHVKGRLAADLRRALAQRLETAA